jgi:predicted DCC family thiol-disulfide oxidoreductase YuxK
LAFEDISALGFNPEKYGLSRKDVTRVLHGVKSDGTVLKGMDAVREACRTVGLGWLLFPTRLPLARTASDWLYRLASRCRGSLGSLLDEHCSGGTCAVRPSSDRLGKRHANSKQRAH